MLYLMFGILVFVYFYCKGGIPIIHKGNALLNLCSVLFMILLWPLFVVLEIINKIRGIK